MQHAPHLCIGNAEAELQIRLDKPDGRLLRAIEEVLGRVRQGTYGICGVCNQPIFRARLKVVPWTHHCRECKERKQSNGAVEGRVRAYIVVAVRPGKSRDVARQITSLPGVKMADECWGSRDVFAVVEVAESQELNKLVMDTIQRPEGVAGTSNHIAID